LSLCYLSLWLIASSNSLRCLQHVRRIFFRENPALKPPAARIHTHFRDGSPLIGGRSFLSYDELTKAAKVRIRFGAPLPLSGELFRIRFGLDLVHVPFPGAAPAVGAAIAGHVPIVFSAVPPAISAIQSGQVRALAVTAPKRIPALPDVPTMAESGVADQEADTLTGIIAPAGTPREIVDKLYREIKRVVALPDVQEKLGAVGFQPVVNTPDEFAARIKLELAKWEKVVHDAKIRVE